MKYELDYKIIGQQLKKRRKALDLTQEEVANKLYGFSENGTDKSKTIRNHESGQSFPFKILLDYCDIYDCDIGYLLGDYEEASHDLNYICSQTGLSEKSVEILKENRFFASPEPNLHSYYDERSEGFIRLINHIIESFTFPTDSEKSDRFPTDEIVRYYFNIIRWKQYEKSKYFREAKNKFDEYVNFCLATEPWSRDVAESVVSSGHLDGILPYDEKTQSKKDWEFIILSEYGDYLSFIRKEKRYQRIDVQEAFSQFLLSDFMEGDYDNGNDQ